MQTKRSAAEKILFLSATVSVNNDLGISFIDNGVYLHVAGRKGADMPPSDSLLMEI